MEESWKDMTDDEGSSGIIVVGVRLLLLLACNSLVWKSNGMRIDLI